MAEVAEQTKVLKGGEFLIADALVESTFTPEDFNEEQQMVRQMVRDFVEQEVFPNLDKIEKQAG